MGGRIGLAAACLAGATAPLLLAAFAPAHTGDERLPVLIVTGANNHDWQWTSAALRDALERSGRFAVDVTRDPAVTLADPALAERYRAIVLDYNGPRWGEAAEASFMSAVRSGLGVAVVHAANNAFEGWTEYEELCGLNWREGTGHGSFHSFDVRVADRDHPVTRGLPDLYAHPDELYHRLVPAPNADYRVLATAFSAPGVGGTGRDEPAIIVRSHGAGRVFHTPLGHVWTDDETSRASYADPQLANLLVRGVEWAATGDVTEARAVPNFLSAWEERAGWRPLFDGESLRGWHAFGAADFADRGWPERDGGWSGSDGTLHLAPGGGGGPIVTDELFGDLELVFSWRVAPGGSGGVGYGIVEEPGANRPAGPEYTLADGGTAADPREAAASLHGLAAPRAGSLMPFGAWNTSRIRMAQGLVEHWLNGERAVELVVDAPPWRALLAESELSGVAGFGPAAPGRIGLTDRGHELWLRDVFVRDLSRPPGREVVLFDGRTLEGWRVIGDALFTVADGEGADAKASIVGAVGGGGQSFLVTERSFGDFILELDVMAELPGNSGIQVRSRLTPDGRVNGYQVEIDPSQRAFSGGLYYEGEGWIQDLEGDEVARGAFRRDAWNRYRIECVGPTLKVWVNGVPTADCVDARDAEGFIGLQVHAGDDTRVRWRDLVLRDLGP